MRGSGMNIRLRLAALAAAAAAATNILPLTALAEGETPENVMPVTVIPAWLFFVIVGAAIALGVGAGYWFTHRKK